MNIISKFIWFKNVSILKGARPTALIHRAPKERKVNYG